MDVCQGCGAPIQQAATGGRRLWCSERCRKGQYAGRCIDCGAPTDGSAGPGKAALRCAACDALVSGARTKEHYRRQEETKRQKVLALLAAGATDREIAQRLGTTPGTASNLIHRLRVYGYVVRRPPGPGRR